MAKPSAFKPSSALDKSFAVLAVLRNAGVPLTLSAIAAEMGIAISSAHSTLGQLAAQGAVQLDAQKRWRLGPALHFLGASFARSQPLYRAGWMELVNLANETGLTAATAVAWNGEHLILNSHRGPASTVAVPFGGRVPLAAASWGKVYYGWNEPGEEPELVSFTDNSIVDLKKFSEAAREARLVGYARDDEEYYPGVAGVCAAVSSLDGYEGLVALLGVKEVVAELGITIIGERLAALAARASHSLGDSSRLRLYGAD